jgi:DNA-binding XRE family transcriptional regulator
MAGHKKFSTLIDKMSPQRRALSDARVKQIRQEILLAELRKHTGLTQQELADKLGVSQPCLSKMEGQDDMQITTLNRLVTSLGGQLDLIVRMPNGGEFSLKQFLESR